MRRIGRHISACSTCVSLKSMDYSHCQKLISENMPDAFISSLRKRVSNKVLPLSYLLHEMDVFLDEYNDPLFASKSINPRALLTDYQSESRKPSHEDRRDNPTIPVGDRETRGNAQPSEDSRNRSEDKSNKRCVMRPVNNAHSIEECRTFGRMSIEERQKVVENNRLCFICLGRHYAKDCQSQKACTFCSKRYSSLLHYNNN